jgi:ADP-ribosylglycohydrolase
VLGSIIGDFIGSVYEHKGNKSIDFPLFKTDDVFKNVFTDDSVLTVAVAEVLLNRSDYATVYRSYARRFPNSGYGGMFEKWFKDDTLGPYDSFGNGSAMRVSPIGWAFESPEDVMEEAKKSAEVTHNHPEGIKGAQAIALAIYLARLSFSKKDIKNVITNTFGYDLNRTCDQIRPTYQFDATCQGTVPEAIIAFLDSTSYESAIRLAISLGGDADTLACITGGIAQAYYSTIPKGMAITCLKMLPNNFL